MRFHGMNFRANGQHHIHTHSFSLKYRVNAAKSHHLIEIRVGNRTYRSRFHEPCASVRMRIEQIDIGLNPASHPNGPHVHRCITFPRPVSYPARTLRGKVLAAGETALFVKYFHLLGKRVNLSRRIGANRQYQLFFKILRNNLNRWLHLIVED